jgi:hypothetical protein
MKYLLPLTLLASAAWAAAHDTGTHDPARDAKAASETVRSSDPPWLTGALEIEDVASDEIDDPHAGLYGGTDDDDPHSGLFVDGDAEMGMCTRDEADDVWSAAGDADQDPHFDPHLGAHGVAAGVELPTAPLPRSSAANGHSIAEVHAQRARLAEQQVRVRGTVVKLTDGILGETYLHLRDGTGSSEREDDDLTVTTTEQFEIGETIEVEGRLRIDQDLGLGYRYPALLAGAIRVVQH